MASESDIVKRLRHPAYKEENGRMIMDTISMYREAQEAAAEITRLRSERSSQFEAVKERCAKVIDDLCERTLAKQSLDRDGAKFADTVNLYIRMATVLLPEAAAGIRALKEGD